MILAQNTVDLESKITKNPAFGNILTFSAPRVITVAIQLCFIVAGVTSFIFLLWGTIQWIFSGGEKEGLEKARKKITGALIGLALALSAFAITKLMELIFGVNILGTLKIPSI